MQTVKIPYRALPSQSEFHKSRARIKLFVGGVGSGKTAAGAHEAVKHALGQPGIHGMIVAPTYSMLRRVTLPAFLDALPVETIAVHRMGQRCIVLKNGSCIWYSSTDRPDTLDGTNLGWWWMDEGRYAREAAYHRLLARLRQPGAKLHQGWITTTPEMNWLYREFVLGDAAISDREVIHAPTSDNFYLPPDYMEQMRASYSDSLYDMYVNGQFVHLSGGVFPQFSRSTHVQDFEIDPRYPVGAAIDFGYRRPAVLYFQEIDFCRTHRTTGCLHVIGEDMPNDCPTVDLVRVIANRYERHRWRRGRAYVDPAGAAHSVTVGYTDVSLLKADGWQVVAVYDPAKRHIPYGIDRMRMRLRPYEGAPTLYIHTSCNHDRGLVRALESSVYPESTAGAASNIPVKDGEFEHARDAARYLVLGLESSGVRVL